MTYQRKTTDYWDIEQYTGPKYGWEIVTSETTRQDTRRSLKEYRENSPGEYRAVKHRERIQPCPSV